jgi:hypothetical protein
MSHNQIEQLESIDCSRQALSYGVYYDYLKVCDNGYFIIPQLDIVYAFMA